MDYRELLEKIKINKNLNVACDSRKIGRGDIFVCIKGFKTDGHDYINEAIKKGASIIVAEKNISLPEKVSLVLYDNTRKALAELSAACYNHPSEKFTLLGVTGTNGKTTTTYMINNIMKKAGLKRGLIGTLGISIGDKDFKSTHTTPESCDLQKIFHQMTEEAVQVVTMEVSSHALSLYRVWNSSFDGIIYTNFSQDHLDFHSTLEEYWKAKAAFLDLQKKFNSKKDIFSVFNGDDPEVIKLLHRAEGRKIVYTAEENNKSSSLFIDMEVLSARNVELSGKGVSFKLDWQGRTYDFSLKLMGMFNVYNALASICAALGKNISMDVIKEALEEMEPVKGRIYPVNKGQNFSCIVDYAHSPDGLEKILDAVRSFTGGKVITLFGCGGDRDRKKRPLMGRIAALLSDFIIVTTDNPRSEDPLSIIKDIEKGIKEIDPQGNNYLIEPDRENAIKKAVHMARGGDSLLVAGKGHETYQIFADKTIDFDDSKIIEKYLLETGR